MLRRFLFACANWKPPEMRKWLPLRGGPSVHDALKNRERNGAVGEHRVVEALEVETIAQSSARGVAHAVDGLAADHVAALLTRPHAVALDLGCDRAFLIAG